MSLNFRGLVWTIVTVVLAVSVGALSMLYISGQCGVWAHVVATLLWSASGFTAGELYDAGYAAGLAARCANKGKETQLP